MWNFDYFKKKRGVIVVYECGGGKKRPDLSSVTLGKFIEDETIEEEAFQIDLNPKTSFWNLMGQKKPDEVFDELKEVIDNKPGRAYHAREKVLVDGVNRAFVKVLKRKKRHK